MTPPTDGDYTDGNDLDFSVKYSEAVTVVGGVPSLQLTIGSNIVNADYVSGSGTDTLLFSRTLTNTDAGEVSLDNKISLNGATIKGVVSGEDASLDLPAVNTSGINII